MPAAEALRAAAECIWENNRLQPLCSVWPPHEVYLVALGRVVSRHSFGDAELFDTCLDELSVQVGGLLYQWADEPGRRYEQVYDLLIDTARRLELLGAHRP